MISLFKTPIGRLRIIGFLEGVSLLVLICIAVPLKYAWHQPGFVKLMGPIHGALFLLYLFNAISVALQLQWKKALTLKILLACVVPFGTFYMDHYVLKPIEKKHHEA